MNLTVEKVVDAYRRVASIPSVVSATLLRRVNSQFMLESVWQQKDLEREKNIKYSKWSNLNVQGSEMVPVYFGGCPPIERNKELLSRYSYCGKRSAVIREVEGKDSKKVQYLEIWDDSKKIVNINLKDMDKHGDVHSNDQFGSLEWTKDGSKVLYIAEKKAPKTRSYFKNPVKENDGKPGEEHLWRESWGEQLTDAHCPTLCLFDVCTKEISLFCDVIPEELSVGQAIWHHDNESVIFVGWAHEPFRFGLRYCPMRKSKLYLLNAKRGICKLLSGEISSVFSPRLHPKENRVVFLENPAGGPHMNCSKLISLSFSSVDGESVESAECKTIIDSVKIAKSEKDFPGLFSINMPNNCWDSDGGHVFITSAWRYHKCILAVNVSNGNIVRLTSDGDSAILDVNDDIIVASYSNPSTPPEIRIAKFTKDAKLKWITVEKPNDGPTCVKWSVHTFKPDFANFEFSHVDCEYILHQPTDNAIDPSNKSLVINPHGGPHSHSAAGFLHTVVALCRLGFTVAQVNYRGSIGFGKDGIDSLPGKVGTQDIKDVHQIATLLKSELNCDRVFVTGGSHGGFVALHLIGQHPDFYSATCVRNPVTNISLLTGTSDIPDWAHWESGITNYDHSTEPTAETYTSMLKISPIVHIKAAKAPTLLMLGEVDLRVPPSQGYQWAKLYKALGKTCKVLEYKENNHPLANVDADADGFVNMVMWFKEHENS